MFFWMDQKRFRYLCKSVWKIWQVILNFCRLSMMPWLLISCRKNLREIALDLEPKIFEDVQEYSKAFWKYFTRLSDHEKILSGIEKGEAKLGRVQDIQRDIAYFAQHYAATFSTAEYHFPKSKQFTPEEDLFLMTHLSMIGYATDLCFERLREEIRKSAMFKFDWFFRTRSSMVSDLMLSCYNNLLILLFY